MEINKIREVNLNYTPEIMVISLSGGMDSTALLLNGLERGFKVYALSFNYGQRHIVELDRVKKNIEYLNSKGFKVKHTIIDISILGKLFNSALTSNNIEIPEGHYANENMKTTVVPNRNAIFSSIAYGYALSLAKEFKTKAYIALGIHTGDHDIYLDCRKEFRDALEYAFKIGNWGSENVSYDTPYLTLDKLGILQDARYRLIQLMFNGNDEKFDEDEFKIAFNTIFSNTNTCYNPDKEGRSCGKCGSCQERLLAFHGMMIPDPVPYQSDFEELTQAAIASEIKFQNDNKHK